MSADGPQEGGEPDNVASFAIPNRDWGVGFEPVSLGDEFFLEDCPVGEDVVMWYLALPDEFETLQSRGKLLKSETDGGRLVTKFHAMPTSAVYNRLTENQEDLTDDYDQIYGYLIGIHECMFDLTVEMEDDRGQPEEVEKAAVFDPLSKWNQAFEDNYWELEGNIPAERMVIYKVERLDGVPDDFGTLREKLNPLEEAGASSVLDNPTLASVDDEGEREQIIEYLQEGQDPRPRSEGDVDEFTSGGGSASFDDAGGLGAEETATPDPDPDDGADGSGGGSDGGDDDEDVPTPESESELQDLTYREMQTVGGRFGVDVIGVGAEELRDRVRDAIGIDESGGSGGDTTVRTTFDEGGSGGSPSADFEPVATSAAVQGDTILLRHEISGDGISEVTDSPDFDPEQMRQRVEQEVLSNVESQLSETGGGSGASGSQSDDGDSVPGEVPGSLSELESMTYNELQSAGSALDLGDSMSSADTEALSEMVAEAAPGLSASDLDVDDSGGSETDDSGGSSDGDTGGAGGNGGQSGLEVPADEDEIETDFDAPQQLLITTTSCPTCQSLKQQDWAQDALQSGQLVEINEMHPDFPAIVDRLDESTAPLLVLYDGETFEVEQTF